MIQKIQKTQKTCAQTTSLHSPPLCPRTSTHIGVTVVHILRGIVIILWGVVWVVVGSLVLVGVVLRVLWVVWRGLVHVRVVNAVGVVVDWLVGVLAVGSVW